MAQVGEVAVKFSDIGNKRDKVYKMPVGTKIETIDLVWKEDLYGRKEEVQQKLVYEVKKDGLYLDGKKIDAVNAHKDDFVALRTFNADKAKQTKNGKKPIESLNKADAIIWAKKSATAISGAIDDNLAAAGSERHVKHGFKRGVGGTDAACATPNHFSAYFSNNAGETQSRLAIDF